ncbi:hypothetical protein BFINE_01860 [Bacteroides finegoldii DSM 17565]|nr:hypothetical protein BFINE_01860 [Bacteroides finegoldii DSM 17565]
MKTLLKSLKITLAFCVFFSVFYILILWVFAQVAGPNKGNAEVATLDGKVVGAANVGQMFTKDIYFWDVLLLPVTGMMRRVPQVVIKGLRIKNIWMK